MEQMSNINDKQEKQYLYCKAYWKKKLKEYQEQFDIKSYNYYRRALAEGCEVIAFLPYDDGINIEQMWVKVLTFDMDKKQLAGVYYNNPINIRTIKSGDKVLVWFKDITNMGILS